MQFLYSALSSNELKALYILLPPAHLYTPAPSQLLNGAYNPDTRYKAPRVINVQQLSLCMPSTPFFSFLDFSQPIHSIVHGESKTYSKQQDTNYVTYSWFIKKRTLIKPGINIIALNALVFLQKTSLCVHNSVVIFPLSYQYITEFLCNKQIKREETTLGENALSLSKINKTPS